VLVPAHLGSLRCALSTHTLEHLDIALKPHCSFEAATATHDERLPLTAPTPAAQKIQEERLARQTRPAVRFLRRSPTRATRRSTMCSPRPPVQREAPGRRAARPELRLFPRVQEPQRPGFDLRRPRPRRAIRGADPNVRAAGAGRVLGRNLQAMAAVAEVVRALRRALIVVAP
jgi:hypothetical protein